MKLVQSPFKRYVTRKSRVSPSGGLERSPLTTHIIGLTSHASLLFCPKNPDFVVFMQFLSPPQVEPIEGGENLTKK